MTFSSLPFLLFLPPVLLFTHLLRKNKNRQQIFLLLASWFFYGWWDVRFLCLMIASTALCWGLALWMERSPRHAGQICTAGIALMLLTLGFFKYTNFFIDSFCALFGITHPGTLRIILPIGISFYTFQGISYLSDVLRHTIRAEQSFVRISLYISFFPQLVAGPIVRSSDFLPQLKQPALVTKENLYIGAQIFLFGFMKKRVFADRIGSFVTAVFAAPEQYGTLTLWLMAFAYTVQIYFDFSGYSDMAIGIARMMGFTLQRNFNAPFLARNPSEFWKRWHISLSQWLRDYLYIPLGGNKGGTLNTCRNLMLTMLLGGLWHGASVPAVLWGALHGLSQCIHRIWRVNMEKKPNPFKNGLSRIITAVFVVLLFVIFRAPDFHSIHAVFTGLFRFRSGVETPHLFSILGILLVLAGHFLAAKHDGDAYYPVFRKTGFLQSLLLCTAGFLAFLFAYTGENPFIYFQF